MATTDAIINDAFLTTLAQVSVDRATILAAIERAGAEPTEELIREAGARCSMDFDTILAEQLDELSIKGTEAENYEAYRS